MLHIFVFEILDTCIYLWGRPPIYFGGKKPTHHNGLFRDKIVKLDPAHSPEERQGNCLNADVSGLRSHLFCLEMEIEYRLAECGLWIWLSLGEMLILKNFPVLEMIAQSPRVVGVLLQATVYRKSVSEISGSARNTRGRNARSGGHPDGETRCFTCGWSNTESLDCRDAGQSWPAESQDHTLVGGVSLIIPSLMFPLSCTQRLDWGQEMRQDLVWNCVWEKHFSLGPVGSLVQIPKCGRKSFASKFRTKPWHPENLDLQLGTSCWTVLLKVQASSELVQEVCVIS